MKKLILLFTLLISFNCFAQIPSYVPTDSLVGWWPFNGNANDESGNGLHGIVSGAILSSDKYGNDSSAYYFDGDDKIEVAHNNILNVTEMTLRISFKTFDNPLATPNGNSLLISKREPTGWGASFEFYGSTSFGSSWTINGNGSIGGGSLIYGNWYDVVYVHRSDSIKIYIDNVLVLADVSPGVYNSNSLPLVFGMRGNGWHELIGTLDDIGIWNRALSETEIKQLFTASQDTCTYTDTTYVTVYDTTVVFDTTYVTVNDTTEVFDTTYVTVNDTATYYDTVLVSVTDTLIIDVTLTGVAPPNNTNTIKVYPNPANDIVIIDNGNFSMMNNYTIKIINTLGQEIFNSNINVPQFQIPVSTFGAEGLYYIEIFDDNNTLLDTRKLILN